MPFIDDVWYADGLIPYSAEGISAAEASNLASLFALRERFDFSWANASERAAQLNMVQGSRGYQTDTRTEYIYDNSSWRVAVGHIEMTATAVVPNGAVALVGSFTVDAALTTDTTMATPTASGTVSVVRPGVYAVSSLTTMIQAPATGRTFIELADPTGIIYRSSIVVGEDAGSTSMPNLRTTAPNSLIEFRIFRNVAAPTGPTNTRIRLTRIG